MAKEKKSSKTTLYIALIIIIFVLSFLYSARRNFRKGIFLDDRFFYLTENTLFESDKQNQIRLKSNGSDTDFTITLNGDTQAASLKWDDAHVTISYENGSVIEGDWNGKYITDSDGMPIATDSDEITMSNGETTQPVGFYQNSALSHALCQISQNKTVIRHSIWIILLGVVVYLIGAIEFLYPEKCHFFLRGWRYKNPELSEEGTLIEKISGIIGMVLGLIAVTGLFIS